MERSSSTLNFFRMINIVIADIAIPMESRNITNPNILSKVFAKNKIIIAKAAKTDKLTTSTFLYSICIEMI